jgi:predicted DNA-binding transcriptional regulator YafY
MRASRLVSLLLLLQTRGRLTAAELARELEVSERTVHRDVDELSAAGVPIYAERGRHGGIRLVEGYRTRLTGMTGDEAEALFLSGLPGPAAQLGLGTVMTAARLKVLAALPSEMRGRASRLVERFHLDAGGWFQAAERVPYLPTVAECVWECIVLTMVYARGGGPVERRVQPLGLVLKGGTWYLVGAVDGDVRTFRVSRIGSAVQTDERFERPPDFDLAAYWADSTAAYEREVPTIEVTLRVRPDRLHELHDQVGNESMKRAERLEEPDPDGWHRLRLRMTWPEEAAGRLLAMGDRVEVLEPASVREQLVELARGALARHEGARP